jgi:hypothetical protein
MLDICLLREKGKPRLGGSGALALMPCSIDDIRFNLFKVLDWLVSRVPSDFASRLLLVSDFASRLLFVSDFASLLLLVSDFASRLLLVSDVVSKIVLL